ncbi:hypothetical protein LEMA_P089120.1 [Plenodomus lingam JN3]|uniref:Uncharacterized protein n=1 Tax=Leptosphaeria maculans (strain JN3 / isolate v23.1.3 / race Av1-4-5-6-7-8) TaxID=985895 RepID=E5A7S8_LEPMJ|nr:hypothetical protein LEMA_P089120.1 [Plenodomus lingam JN3]CBX99673.1 hypothetical protein LEMA_P089120.1 [Plenodomus lingam JN3]
MSEPPLTGSRKRRHSETPQLNETSRPVLKKQRLSPPSESQPPPAFWDNLSKIWLTKRALRELDRRNAQAAPSPPRSSHQRARRPVTRNFLGELKRNGQTTQYIADYLRYEPRILKNIKLFARHGGPHLSDLRNFREPIRPPDHAMSSSQSSSRSRQQSSVNPPSTDPTTNTTKTESTGAHDRNFEQYLVDHDVYPHGYRHPNGSVPIRPDNRAQFNQIFARRRPSLSPSIFNEEEFENFVQADADAREEKQVSELVIPIIEGKIRDAKCRSGGIPFTNLDPLTDGTLKPGNPDIYYGARPEQLNRKVRDELGGQIIPSTQHDLPMAPNFLLACYDGALGARAIHTLRSYKQDEPVYDNNAYTMTSIYHGGTLKMYTSHVVSPRSPGGRPQYHMTQVDSFAITGNRNTCAAGLQTYRNGRDWAEKQRDEAIRLANERANSMEVAAPANNVRTSPALSFVTAVSETEAYNKSQEPQTSLNGVLDTREDFEQSDSSIEELVDYRLPAKRTSRCSKRSEIQQKRRNTDDSSATRYSEGCTVTTLLTNTTPPPQ